MITIKVRQVCLLINRDNGVDVVFPVTGHDLVMETDKSSGRQSISGEFLLEVFEQSGKSVPRTPTGAADRTWIPDVGDVAGTQARGKSLEQLRHVPSVRAVVSLTGGRLVTGRAVPPPQGPDYAMQQWNHGNWSGRLTNWVEWQYEPGDQKVVLTKDGKTFLELRNGDKVVLTNADVDEPSQPSGNDVFAEDFAYLYALVNAPHQNEEAVRPKTRRLPDQYDPGTENPRLPLCPVGQADE